MKKKPIVIPMLDDLPMWEFDQDKKELIKPFYKQTELFSDTKSDDYQSYRRHCEKLRREYAKYLSSIKLPNDDL